MELLQQIMEAMLAGFQFFVDLLAPVIASLVGTIFDVEVSPEAAHGFATLTVVLVAAWLISKAFQGVTKSPANQPMKVELYTAKTPAQVVGDQRRGKFKTLLAACVVLALVYFFGIATAP
jgi:hypothetical protein